ncbi:hypothetical protein [Kiloniella sp.]|uniref:hypothetical protein n=1 Tax=Kiloniella sp. TaxID=1938587 RepID=UPI003B025B36
MGEFGQQEDKYVKSSTCERRAPVTYSVAMKHELDDDLLKEVVVEITNNLPAITTVDWLEEASLRTKRCN